jgi:hypothetical protein
MVLLPALPSAKLRKPAQAMSVDDRASGTGPSPACLNVVVLGWNLLAARVLSNLRDRPSLLTGKHAQGSGESP